MSDRIDVILDLTRRLSALVEREISLIEAHQPNSIGEFEEERTRLSLLYSREMQAVKSDPAAVKKSSRDRIERLREETASFNASLDRHQRLIARMRRVSEGIVKTIADEAARQRAPKSSYGASGGASYRAKATPIAINRKI
ncbi:hypothetical protein sos41_12900 [Alphaproteobacteria bacterium SO-S41]|nr:hypothetical protein sos41_12900 [Alphaproteobacteria bacterium SO-S41]